MDYEADEDEEGGEVIAKVPDLPVYEYPGGLKDCSVCREVKSVQEFYRHVIKGIVYRTAACKDCKGDQNLRSRMRRFGVSNPRRHLRLIRGGKPDEKRCSACRRTKPLSEFALMSDAPDGLQYRCRECARQAGRWRRSGERARQVRSNLPLIASDREECVCGALKEHHRHGKGSCAATGCPEWFERGA